MNQLIRKYNISGAKKFFKTAVWPAITVYLGVVKHPVFYRVLFFLDQPLPMILLMVIKRY
jgi:hypothetical protein